MKIQNYTHIPDRETYETNQFDVLTDAQKEYFGNEINNTATINSTSDTFLFLEKTKKYNFKRTQINFVHCAHPFANQNAQLLPGIEYNINYLALADKNIFLSAEPKQPISPDAVYQSMIANLQTCFEFSHEDLIHNQRNMLSSKQLNRHRKGLKEYDPDPSVGFFDFIYMGEQTKENLPIDRNYVQKISPYFTNWENILLFNVEYRIYYEKNRSNFLSIEPKQIMASTNSPQPLQTTYEILRSTAEPQAETQTVIKKEPDHYSTGCRATSLLFVFSSIFFCIVLGLDQVDLTFAFYLYVFIILISLAFWSRSVRKK